MPTDNSTAKNARKVSTKKKQPDPLKPYRAQSERILAMLFDDDSTPAFMRDLLSEMLSELESETQVYWNRREIAAIALPYMLEEAHAKGIDFFSERSEIFSAAAYNLRQRIEHPDAPPSEFEVVSDAMEADAAAIYRILHSPHIPEMVKRDLGDRVCELDLHPIDNAAVFRVAWPLAVLKAMKEEKEETREEMEETHARITRDQIVTRRSLRQTQAMEGSAGDGQ
jgi:hypothetical protein